MSDKVEILKKIELYRASHPDLKRLTDEQIIRFYRQRPEMV